MPPSFRLPSRPVSRPSLHFSAPSADHCKAGLRPKAVDQLYGPFALSQALANCAATNARERRCEATRKVICPSDDPHPRGDFRIGNPGGSGVAARGARAAAGDAGGGNK
jgi:hypothetical protein